MLQNTCSHLWYEIRAEEVLADVVIIASVGTGPQLQLLNSLIGRLEPSTHNSSKSFSPVLPEFFLIGKIISHIL